MFEALVFDPHFSISDLLDAFLACIATFIAYQVYKVQKNQFRYERFADNRKQAVRVMQELVPDLIKLYDYVFDDQSVLTEVQAKKISKRLQSRHVYVVMYLDIRFHAVFLEVPVKAHLFSTLRSGTQDQWTANEIGSIRKGLKKRERMVNELRHIIMS